jgi:hypothetical protein
MNGMTRRERILSHLQRDRYKYSTCAVVAVCIFLLLTEKKVAIETCKL